ncbi:hypothetical protein AHAS_Ahas17G0094000 [Arachis hypogaea]
MHDPNWLLMRVSEIGKSYVEDLSRVYRLLQQIPGCLRLLAILFNKHITAEGMVLIQQEEEVANNQVLIRKIIEAHDKYMAYVNDCFMIDTKFHKVVKLLVYINDKDHFAKYCRKNLARRLLFTPDTNEEQERILLSMLKQQFGGNFTLNMERMELVFRHEDKRKMVEDLDKDRQYTIDAAIVRIMKSRKVLGYQQLLSKCVEMLSPLFKPEIKTIKKRIEHLIATGQR